MTSLLPSSRRFPPRPSSEDNHKKALLGVAATIGMGVCLTFYTFRSSVPEQDASPSSHQLQWPSGARYLGCFMDHLEWRDLGPTRTMSQAMTASSCFTFCTTQLEDFRYFSLQTGAECYCGHSYGKLGRVVYADNAGGRQASHWMPPKESSEAAQLSSWWGTCRGYCPPRAEVDLNQVSASDGCKMPCTGHSQETCGGGYENAVYEILRQGP